MKYSPFFFVMLALSALAVVAVRTPVPELVAVVAGPDTNELRLSLDTAGKKIQVTEQGHLILERALASVSELTVEGNASDNTLLVDFSNGNPIPPGGLTWDGKLRGTDFDILALEGSDAATVSHAAVNPHDGRYLIAAADFEASIAYENLEPVTDNMGAVVRTFDFMGAAETVTVSDDATGNDGNSRVASTLGELVDFVHPSDSVIVDVTSTPGVDTVNVQGLDAQFAQILQIATKVGDTVNVQTNPLTIANNEFEILGSGDTHFAQPVDTGTGRQRYNDISVDGKQTLTGLTVSINGGTFGIGGTTPGGGLSEHDQLDVAGAVGILDGTLVLNARGAFAPSNGEVFVIINNDGFEPVNGTFQGLPERAVIPNFLGSGQNGTISYEAGDGNDVAVGLSIPTPVAAPDNSAQIAALKKKIKKLQKKIRIAKKKKNKRKVKALNKKVKKLKRMLAAL